jgi:hypothetical protein
MITFKFEVRLVVDIGAATATVAYKKLVEQLPTAGVSELEMKVLSTEDERAVLEAKRNARRPPIKKAEDAAPQSTDTSA